MKSSSRNVWRMILGILEICLGIYIVFNPAETIMSLSNLCGFVLLAGGITEIVLYFKEYRDFLGSSRILLNGILSAFIGFLFFISGANQLLSAILPYMFAMAFIFRGIDSITFGSDLSKVGFSSETLVYGVIILILGIMSLFNPGVASVYVAWTIGLTLIVDGINWLRLSHTARKLRSQYRKAVKQASDILDADFTEKEADEEDDEVKVH